MYHQLVKWPLRRKYFLFLIMDPDNKVITNRFWSYRGLLEAMRDTRLSAAAHSLFCVEMVGTTYRRAMYITDIVGYQSLSYSGNPISTIAWGHGASV